MRSWVCVNVSGPNHTQPYPVFSLEPDHAGAPLTGPYALSTQVNGRVLVGAPLPAHTRILCDGSELFPAELERWRRAGGSGVGDGESRPAKRQRGAGDAVGRPQLSIGLWAPGERWLAEALLRFMYCGVLHLRTLADLLRARPLALRLAVEGGVEACDDAIRAALEAAEAREARGAAGGCGGSLRLSGAAA
ncbi:hypothetical protein HXX76_013429 [Chlamydomonas incerta]|uniref:BTB domain-containing protein n=1 Tax=Chlamydomonas incerta TaxID=51695 RepID=A0A835VUB0_CHLIN|nr:hypothetical protein HXX76_013429 [Chlamydomonas incerta]|eukprot:KAG2425804.1 hypothetical protein HXX76_013429 [Chlamydomonas incerta]